MSSFPGNFGGGLRGVRATTLVRETWAGIGRSFFTETGMAISSGSISRALSSPSTDSNLVVRRQRRIGGLDGRPARRHRRVAKRHREVAAQQEDGAAEAQTKHDAEVVGAPPQAPSQVV
jgi:hypothetical protein